MAQKPVNPAGGESPRASTRMLAEDLARLDEAAKRQGLTRGEMLRLFVRQGLDQVEQAG